MAFGKVAQYMTLLLVICYNLQIPEHFFNVFFKLKETNTSFIHARQKRQTLSSENITYEIQAGINVVNLSAARELLSTLKSMTLLDETGEILEIEITTACSSVGGLGYQCRCEKDFVWPPDRCIDNGCSSNDENQCRCLTEIPGDGQYCQRVDQNERDAVSFELFVDVRAITAETPDLIDRIRTTLENMDVPLLIGRSVNLTNINLTTVCNADLEEQQCKCELGFVWPSDKCASSNCSEITCDTCRCINGLPEDGRFCEPINDTAQCPSTTTPMTPTVSPITETVEITLEQEFDEVFNEENTEIINSIIQRQAPEHITRLISASEPRFRRGSTIISFDLTAPDITAEELLALKTGLFKELSGRYPVVFDSSREIPINPPDEVFFGSNVTMTCGPPLEELNFGTIQNVEWTRDGVNIEDFPNINSTTVKGMKVLIMSNVLPTDNGKYECRLENENGSFFRQEKFISTVFDRPVIRVTPITQTVSCRDDTVQVNCFVEGNYTVLFKEVGDQAPRQSITYNIDINPECTEESQMFTCVLAPYEQFSETITLRFTTRSIDCVDNDDDGVEFGAASLNDIVKANCNNGSVGEISAVCRPTGFEDRQDNCVLAPIQRLLDWSEAVTNLTLPEFLDELSNVTVNLQLEVARSPATIIAIVKILNNVAGVAQTTVLNTTLMEDIILTSSTLTIDEARESWTSLYDVKINSSETNVPGRRTFERRMSKTKSFMEKFFTTKMSEILGVGSSFLLSLEDITTRVINNTLNLAAPLILFNKTRSAGSYNIETNLTEIDIPEVDGFITAITFISMDNVLPARDEANSSSKFINGRVVLVQSTDTIDNISFAYDRLNQSLANPECVFWNFALFDGLGGWDDEGCQFVLREDNTFTCTCNHLTSFSMLMSFGTLDNPSLAYITFIGLGISLASLVICLIIEAVIWRKIRSNRTSYLRHVSIVNIAVSLLIADIWLIVALTIPNQSNIPLCIAATFFVHLFYLALFFWMLASALLLFYRAVNVMGDISKSTGLASGFCLGYGVPIIIAAITIAVTAPENEYIRQTGGCWLNWDESRALLAFVIPVLLIVLINFIILIVVIYKIWKSRTASLSATQPNDQHVTWVIIKSLAILTPLFGLTWALGVGTLVDPNNLAIHIAFSFFNSLQGFFVLVFGTLIDKKVRSEITSLSTSGTGTRSTSGGFSGLLGRLKRNTDGNHTSSSEPLNSSNT